MPIRFCDNPVEWNEKLHELNGTLYHSWQWGELRRVHGWIPWRISIEAHGEIAALQILERRLPFLHASVLYAPRWIAHRNAEFPGVTELVQWLRGFLQQRNALFLRIDPDIPALAEGPKNFLTTLGFRYLASKGSMWNLPRATMALEISQPEEELLCGMREAHRRHILRAAKSGIEWSAGTQIEQLQEFYELLVKRAPHRKSLPMAALDE